MAFSGRPWTHLWLASDAPDTPGDWPASTVGSPTFPFDTSATYTPRQSTAAFPSIAAAEPGLVDRLLAVTSDASTPTWDLPTGPGGIVIGASVRAHHRIVGVLPAAGATAVNGIWSTGGGTQDQSHVLFSSPAGSVQGRLRSGPNIGTDGVAPVLPGLGFLADLIVEPDGVMAVAVNGSVRRSSGPVTRSDTDGRVWLMQFASGHQILGYGISLGAGWWSEAAHRADVQGLGLPLIIETQAAASTDPIPASFAAGETVSWRTESAEYPSSGYTLRTILSTSTARLEVSGVAQSDGSWSSTITRTQSEGFVPGVYEWRAYAETSTERYQIGAGRVTVRPSALTSAADLRSPDQIALDAIDAVLAGRASRDQEEMTFSGRSIRRHSIESLMRLRAYYASRVAQEHARARGTADPAMIRTRFTR